VYTTHNWVDVIIAGNIVVSANEIVIADHSAILSHVLLHDRPLSSVARDESRMAGGEPRMTGDYCLPEESIHRCVCTHSHLYSYIYGLVALLDKYTIKLL